MTRTTTTPKVKPTKPQKTGPSAATTAILALLFIMVVLYVIFQIVGNFRAAYDIASAYSFSANDETTVTGYVIREESLLPNQNSGVLDITRDEGERVAAGQSVATVYANESAVATAEQLDALRARLEHLNFALEEATGATTAVKLDSSIQASLFSLQKDLRHGQHTALAKDISELQALVVRRDYTAGGADPEELRDRIKATKDEIKTLQAQQQRSVTQVTVPSAGLFSAVTDGYEGVLKPAALETMTPSQLAGVTPDKGSASNVGKMIYGSTWYYAANMDEQTASAYKVGHTVELRFVNELDRSLTMTVQRASDSENGQKLVVFSCREYLPEVTLLRRQRANLIHESYEGIRVPTEALRVEEGVTGVYCLVGMQAVFKPVDVVYQGSGYYLVEPAKKKDDTENTSSSRLRVGDSVLITAQPLYSGKVIEG